jgi:hypothetical protein
VASDPRARCAGGQRDQGDSKKHFAELFHAPNARNKPTREACSA